MDAEAHQEDAAAVAAAAAATAAAVLDATTSATDLGSRIILPLEEFAEDLEVRLGRANGNIYHRRPGLEGVHDGQVMVRLKKKRFIVIDYSILPTEEDLQIAATMSHVCCPAGAGKQKCATAECPKVGVPVLLYDSDPTQPASLYMRSGLCFTCQRNLNEKRRTQRKRPSETVASSVLYAVGPGQKKVKLQGGSVMELQSDAVILNGPPIQGVKSVRDGFGFHEIGLDLIHYSRSAAQDTEHLINAVGSNTTATTTTTTGMTTVDTGAAATKVAPNGTASDDPTAQMAASAAAVAVSGDPTPSLHSVDVPTSAAVDATSSLLHGDGHGHHQQHQQQLHQPHDIGALYDRAFQSLSKSIYLLTQWKQSWDAAISAAVAQETAAVDPSLADAVASAAAVVAVGSNGSNGTGPGGSSTSVMGSEMGVMHPDNLASPSHMVSLLLAADQRKVGPTEHQQHTSTVKLETHDVEAFEV